MMKHYTKSSIEEMDRTFRLNLINSISGYKSANLIATIGPSGENLAIISSVVHLGANPPLLGFIMRPQSVERHTLENIKTTKKYTINHVEESFVKNAHYTSTKFKKEVSEFDACNIEKEYREDFQVPFVKRSHVKMGINLEEIIDIKSNQTMLVVGSIQLLRVSENCITDNGQLDLNKNQTVCISGLNRYHQVKEIANFPYARLEELPDFN